MHAIDPFRCQQIVGAVEPDERHGNLLQLACTVAPIEHRTELGRQEPGNVLVVSRQQPTDTGLRPLRGRHAAEAQPQRSIAVTVRDPRRRQGHCKHVVDQGLTRVRRCFELRHRRAGRPGHHEGSARRAEQVVRLRAAGNAARHS